MRPRALERAQWRSRCDSARPAGWSPLSCCAQHKHSQRGYDACGSDSGFHGESMQNHLELGNSCGSHQDQQDQQDQQPGSESEIQSARADSRNDSRNDSRKDMPV
eukprot:359690-Chlamydomonas_euryale.AAC.5